MRAWLFNAAYLTFLLVVSPWILYRRIVQRKPIAGFRTKLTGRMQRRHPERPCIWLHAVSVGEVLQLKSVLARMRADNPDREFVITTTTGTGFDVARSKYPDCTIQFFPFDFSWAVHRALDTLRPELIVLVELELWPTFLFAAQQRQVPVAIINGRISEKSFAIYRRVTWLTRPLLACCRLIAAQNRISADRFLALGAPADRVIETGNIKFDGLETDRLNPHTASLRHGFGLAGHELVFLAGSTQDPEESLALATWEALRTEFPQLRLLLVPRHKERFEEVAALIQSRGHTMLRRSDSRITPQPDLQPATLNAHASVPVLLLDTLGELSRAWGLADVAFVGGSLTNRGGQNMMEPAAYGAAVLFGPNTWNFRDVTDALLTREAACVVRDASELTSTVRRFLVDAAERQRCGASARQFAISQQGATDRTVDLLNQLQLSFGGVASGQAKAA